MPAKKQSVFQPRFAITGTAIKALMRLVAARQTIEALPLTPRVLAGLRETARLFSTHYSTQIEGNRLTQQEVSQVLAVDRPLRGRERDQQEVLGYYAALQLMERMASINTPLAEKDIQRLHAVVMGGGRARSRPSPYRQEQNVIRDSRTQRIVYLPPEANEVPALMSQLVVWLNLSLGDSNALPTPMVAAIAHYQFATIHPYYDGNGRTARLLTNLVLHRGGYGLKGLYSLEEHYARDLSAYYNALTVGPSHNYHLGRAEADITGWMEYFLLGMAASVEKIETHARAEARTGAADLSLLLRTLDARQRRALTLFQSSREITAAELAGLLKINPRTAANLCRRWVETGFLVATDTSRKSRRYRLTDHWEQGLTQQLQRGNALSFQTQTARPLR